MASSANTDSGVTLGMVGHFLTWLQEHTAEILVVMTCNTYELLPAELTRAGRIDERFFVDIPGLSEREEIAAVHLRKYEVPDPACAALVAGLSDGWTGAEIEQLVRSAARRTRRAITQDSLVTCAADIKPISKVRAGEITALRDWGKANLRMANTPEVAAPIGRRIGKAAR